ncbi:MAG: tetratricopeptide repeat protein [Acidobacteriota bacterium]
MTDASSRTSPRRLNHHALKAGRQRQKIRQVDAATSLGLAERHYRRIEKGEQVPTPGLLERIIEWAWDELDMPEHEVIEELPSPPAKAPAPSSNFVGREDELAEIARRLKGAGRLVTVLGPPGVGKTRLALQHVERSTKSWSGGTWFCDLSEARSLEGVVQVVAGALAIPLSDDPVAQLGHALSGRGRCLLVLDNFEQVAQHARETAGRWLEQARDLRILVTSRTRLELTGERLLPLAPLRIELEGVQLFEQRARAQQAEFVVDDANRAMVEEVVQLLDGLPLAIELAAARLQVLSVEQVRDRLQDRFRLLARHRGADEERHETLKTAIDWSWALLEPEEQSLFAQLSVFEGGFTVEAAESVVDLSAHAQDDWLLDHVQTLLDKSLLRPGTSDPGRGRPEVDGPYLGMYVSLHEYASGQLMELDPTGGLRDATRDRHASHFARFGSEQAIQSLDTRSGPDRRRRLRRELDNVIAACRHAIGRGDGETAVSCLAAAWATWELVGPFSVARSLAEEVSAMEGLDDTSRRRALRLLGLTSLADGDMEASLAHFLAGLELSREQRDSRSEGRFLLHLGTWSYQQGRTDEARERFDTGRQLSHDAGDASHEALSLAGLGMVCENEGENTAAHDHYHEALAIHRRTKNRRLEGVVLNTLGIIERNQGRTDEAERCFQSALAIQRELGNQRVAGLILGNLGLLDQVRGRFEEGRAHLQEGERLLGDVGDRRFRANLLGNLGSLLRDRGELTEARSCFERALTLHREVDNRHSEAYVLDNIGVLLREEGRHDEAIEQHEAALAIALELGPRWGVGVVHDHLGVAHSRRGDADQAVAAFAEGEAILREVGVPQALAQLLVDRAAHAWSVGDATLAQRDLTEADELARQVDAGGESVLGRAIAALRMAMEGAG